MPSRFQGRPVASVADSPRAGHRRRRKSGTAGARQLARRGFEHTMPDGETGHRRPGSTWEGRSGSARPLPSGSPRFGSLAVMPLRGFLSVGHSRKDRLRALVPFATSSRLLDAGRVGPNSGPQDDGPPPAPYEPERCGVGLHDVLSAHPRERSVEAVVFLRARYGSLRTSPHDVVPRADL
jgi:hypothetical protein